MIERIEAWLRMRDSARFKRDADDAGDSIAGIGRKAKTTDAQMSLLSNTTRKTGTGLKYLAIGTGVAIGGLGLVAGAAATAGAAIGIKFNASMEQNTVAFTQFLGNTQRAKTYLEDLYQISAVTPFEFPDLVSGARKFLAFGFAADETKRILMTVGDTVAGLGGGAEEINRITMAFGQMKAKGRVQTEELLQLAELGVPALEILRKELGLTADELDSNLRKGAIKATDGIAALERGMREAFGGASAAQAETLNGRLSTMKDYARLALGALSTPLFNLARDKALPFINKQLQVISEWALSGQAKFAIDAFKTGFKGEMPFTVGLTGINRVMAKVGAGARVVLSILTKGFNAVKSVVTEFFNAIKPAAPFFRNVLWPLFKGFAGGVLLGLIGMFKLLIFALKILSPVLGWIGDRLKPLRGAFQLIGGVLGFLATGPILGGTRAFQAMGKVMRALRGSASSVVRWVATKFTNLVGFLRTLPGKAATALAGLWDGVKTGLVAALNWVINKINWVIDKINFLPGPDAGKIPLIGGGGKPKFGGGEFPGRAQGGTFTNWAYIGEEGPELARHTPSYTEVIPLSRARQSRTGLDGAIQMKIEVPVIMRGREVARVSADEVAEWNARKGR